MIAILETVTETYDEFISSGDPTVTPWFLMKSPLPTILLVSFYVIFVKVIGPAWMKNREPFDLRAAMFAYNFGLVIAYLHFTKDAFRALLKSGKGFTCRINNINDPNEFRLAELGWWFFFLKLVELMDTVFFVLRKKFRQISTLHLVHHTLVPVAVWCGFRVEPANYNYFFPLINTIVHIVMYSYYGLAALGPNVQKYLWWKKYLTTFQITQFVMVFIYLVSLAVMNCRVSKFIIYLNIFLAGLFLLMFSNYFRNTYLQSKNPGRRNIHTQRSTQEEKVSFDMQRIYTTFDNQVLDQSLEKKIG